jgi:peroxiredoxin
MAKDDMAKEDDMTKDDMAKEDDMTKEDMDKEDDMAEDDMDEKMMTNEGPMADMFELTSLKGETYNLSDLKGQKVYVKFWASWCSICTSGLDELDELTAMEKEYKVITIVSPDYNGESSETKFREWFEKRGHDNLVVLLDYDGEVSRAFGVRGYPTQAFIGSDGVLVHLYPGHLNNDVIEETFMNIH